MDVPVDTELMVKPAGKRGKTKAKVDIAKDAVRKQAPSTTNGGNWVVVADKVEVHIAFNF
ncbi:SCVP6 [Saguaro cactus virus]|uniref:SCVP6 n=1 Tax=Saguaro cactus virus TaxID=52274 RepID=P89109_9TOMB|nr:SCVP6 [Saguaro cactus virus]AAB36709.1 SCVP6 [Saguaro cactus virus]